MAERQGWEVVGEFTDEASVPTAATVARAWPLPKALAVQTAAEHGRCILVAQDADRFARGAGVAPGARKSQAITTGLKRRAERGQPVGALPVGYRAITSVIDGTAITTREIDSDETALVERIFTAALGGSTRGSSRALNADGAASGGASGAKSGSCRHLWQPNRRLGLLTVSRDRTLVQYFAIWSRSRLMSTP
jgi:hypothetical protein